MASQLDERRIVDPVFGEDEWKTQTPIRRDRLDCADVAATGELYWRRRPSGAMAGDRRSQTLRALVAGGWHARRRSLAARRTAAARAH